MKAKLRRRLGALAAASGLAACGGIQSHSAAAIVPITRGNTNVSGLVQVGPPNQNPTERHQYNDGSGSVEGGPVHVSTSGHTEIPLGSPTPEASASSSASQDTPITFDPANDLLRLNSTNVVRSDTAMAPPTQTRVYQGHAEAQSTFSTSFRLTDHAYDYALTLGDFFLNHQGPVPEAGFARVELLSNATGKDLFFREFSLFDGTTSSTGSLSGALAPGDYRFSIDLFGPTSGAGGHTDGRLVAGLLLQGSAPEIKWAGPTGGSFQTNTDWDPQRVPGASDRAAIDLPGTYTVTLDQDVTNDRLRVNGSNVNVTFDLAGHNYTVDQLNIGGQPGDSGRFTIKDSGGISVSAASTGPRAAAAPPPLNLVRATSMAVRGGEPVEIAAAMASNNVFVGEGGSALVAGAAAQWTADQFVVEKGTVALSNQASITSRSVTLGTGLIFTGAGATATITGNGTGWATEDLVVASDGNGELTVRNQGGLFFNRMTIGSVPAATGTVTVDGTTHARQLEAGVSVIGDEGTGNLTLQNNAELQAIHATWVVGQKTRGVGNIAVTGGAGLLVGSLNVGPAGSGFLAVDRGGKVGVSPVGLPGSAVVGAHGLVGVNANGTFESGHLLEVNGTFRVEPRTGLAVVGDNPGTFALGKLYVSTNGTLSGNGTIFGRVKSVGGTNAFTGHTRPGTSPGTLTIAGEFEQEGGVLDIQVAGTSPGQFDVLKIIADPDAGLAGDASIAGDLSLEFLDGFAPHAGDRFDFLTATGSLTGQFQHVEVLNLAPGFQFDLRNENGHYALIAMNDGVAVPEPAAGLLLIVSSPLLLRRRRNV